MRLTDHLPTIELVQTPASPPILLGHSRVQHLLGRVISAVDCELRDPTHVYRAKLTPETLQFELKSDPRASMVVSLPKGLFEALQDASSMPDVEAVQTEPVQAKEESGPINRLQQVLFRANPRAFVRLNPEDEKKLAANIVRTPWGSFRGMRTVRLQPHAAQTFILDPNVPPGHCILGRWAEDTDGPLDRLLTTDPTLQRLGWIWKHGIEDRPLAMRSSAKLDADAPWTVVNFAVDKVMHTNEVMPAEPACSSACSERSPCGVCRQRAIEAQDAAVVAAVEKSHVSLLLDAINSVKMFEHVLLNFEDAQLIRKHCQDLYYGPRPPGDNYQYYGRLWGQHIWSYTNVPKGQFIASHDSFADPVGLILAKTAWLVELQPNPSYPWVVVAYDVPRPRKGAGYFHRPFER